MIRSTTVLAAALAVLFTTVPAIAADKPGHPQGQKDGHHDQGKHKGWQKQAWKRGDRIPLAYIEPRYYVDDYRVYRLQPPPAGYRWVRPMDDRYLLVNIADGLIAQALGY